MITINMQYFGNNGAASGKSGGASKNQPVSAAEVAEIARKAKYVKTSNPNSWSVYEAETEIGKITIRERSNWLPNRGMPRWSVEAHGLLAGTGQRMYADTLNKAKTLGRQMLMWKN